MTVTRWCYFRGVVFRAVPYGTTDAPNMML